MKHAYALLSVLLATAGQAQVTHEIEVEDSEFDPPFLTINLGDHVSIVWDDDVVFDHNFLQVDASTWMANGNTPLAGGYELGDGTPNPGHAFTITPTADVWYVCGFHAEMGMKGTITVVGANAIEEPSAQDRYRFGPNPATDHITMIAADSRVVQLRLTDAAGRTCFNRTVIGGEPLDLGDVLPGLYGIEVRDMDGGLLSRQRLVVAR